MSKDIKIGIFTALCLLALLLNIERIFYATISFFLLGVIPGTQIAIPSIIVFTVAVVAISAMIAWPLKKYIPEKYNTKLPLQDVFKSKTSV